MQPPVNELHAYLIALFDEHGGYDAATLYVETPARSYRINGLKNAARILTKQSAWVLRTKHLGVIASVP